MPRTLFPRPLAPLYVPLVFYVAPKRRIDRKLGVPWCCFVKRNVNPCSPRSRDEILICTTNHALIVNERSNRARELAPRSRIADFPPATRVSPALTAFPFIPPRPTSPSPRTEIRVYLKARFHTFDDKLQEQQPIKTLAMLVNLGRKQVTVL